MPTAAPRRRGWRAGTARAAAAAPLLLLLAPLIAAPRPAAAAGEVDAIVIGAGVAGLKAALDLATGGNSVTVLEARPRTGGRIHTLNDPRWGAVELGAQWIHGQPNVLTDLCKERGWKRLPSDLVGGVGYEATSQTTAKEITDAQWTAWEKLFSDLEERIEVLQEESSDGKNLAWGVKKFIREEDLTDSQIKGVDFMVNQEWVQEYAASTKRLSLNWFDNDAEDLGGDSIIERGYSAVPDDLLSQARAKGVKVLLNQTVAEVDYSEGDSVVVTTTDGQAYTASFAVVTLPLGVLQAKKRDGGVAFSPRLPSTKRRAIKNLKMGVLNKVILGFPDSAKWTQYNWVDRIPLPTDAGRWREFFSLRNITGKPLIVAFNAGDAALYGDDPSDETLVADAVSALRAMFGADNIPDPDYSLVTRWHQDPYTFGSYSVVAAGAKGTERKDLAAPVGKLLYFAGEAADVDYPSTVQGAWLSGAAAAKAAVLDHP
ncbi:hypothetical protein Rsub_07046 [Raphidocelis subcapitata]|uniref:Amine oxidase domain-containing protein n=1 Tax=Raphidocelis subcapitata TaxID=307507 RepID=A0A2V0P6G3_9CHLO|nr:hypothetical protein Rsub_07046 [Raphidocelis subcapitata]|eukprot:GBF94512.1 hypothetical protein Rsub_07046 [Raphidocelis subcapitata]